MIRRNTDADSAESGFTLLEVLLAMVILAIGLLSIGVAQLSAMKMSSRSRNLSQATYVAERDLESFLALPGNDTFFTTVVTDVDDGAFDVDPTDNDQTTFTRRHTVEMDPDIDGDSLPDLGLSRVTINVRWDSPSRAVHEINLQGVKRRVP